MGVTPAAAGVENGDQSNGKPVARSRQTGTPQATVVHPPPPAARPVRTKRTGRQRRSGRGRDGSGKRATQAPRCRPNAGRPAPPRVLWVGVPRRAAAPPALPSLTNPRRRRAHPPRPGWPPTHPRRRPPSWHQATTSSGNDSRSHAGGAAPTPTPLHPRPRPRLSGSPRGGGRPHTVKSAPVRCVRACPQVGETRRPKSTAPTVGVGAARRPPSRRRCGGSPLPPRRRRGATSSRPGRRAGDRADRVGVSPTRCNGRNPQMHPPPRRGRRTSRSVRRYTSVKGGGVAGACPAAIDSAAAAGGDLRGAAACALEERRREGGAASGVSIDSALRARARACSALVGLDFERYFVECSFQLPNKNVMRGRHGGLL